MQVPKANLIYISFYEKIKISVTVRYDGKIQMADEAREEAIRRHMEHFCCDEETAISIVDSRIDKLKRDKEIDQMAEQYGYGYSSGIKLIVLGVFLFIIMLAFNL